MEGVLVRQKYGSVLGGGLGGDLLIHVKIAPNTNRS